MHMYIHTYLYAGPADKTRQVEVGDVLFEVDGRYVCMHVCMYVSFKVDGMYVNYVCMCACRYVCEKWKWEMFYSK
jgi:hypothetical protein